MSLIFVYLLLKGTMLISRDYCGIIVLSSGALLVWCGIWSRRLKLHEGTGLSVN